MTSFEYQTFADGIPAIPILSVRLFQPGQPTSAQFECASILDTGSDCTLLPLPVLVKAKGQPIHRMTWIPVCGMEVLAIPIIVGLVFAQHELLSVRVYGCAVEEIGETGLMGQDILNRFQIEFDGLALTFHVRKVSPLPTPVDTPS
ncbi:hypothetical protein ACQ4M3_26280 [Leptolyngbya sp. AN03gr2]|uniref:hypothetical protein n=1 Tax=unclassified Leptolyngbya TaxID=2650499 RepID=UPI003D3158B8